MLQLANRTPFTARMAVLADARGVETLCVALRATFTLAAHRLQLADEQPLPQIGDAYRGAAASTSLRAANELHLAKPGTDVLLEGNAWAHEGRPTPVSAVRMRVAERTTTIAVFGDRRFERSGLGHPQPFTTMPLQYERAFGGSVRERDGTLRVDERNPIGRGLDAKPGAVAPNLEDPRCLLTTGRRPAPLCLAPIAPSWQPRRGFAGTYDEGWRRERAPFLPRDFDARFFRIAHPELAFDRHLVGEEPIEIHGVSPQGAIAFALPRCALAVRVRERGRWHAPAVRLHTVLVESEDARVSLTFFADHACAAEGTAVDRVTIEEVA